MVGSDSVKSMFKKKFPSLSSLGSDGNTSFLRAARAGHLDKVLEQLRNNVDINTSNANGLNALHLASKDGHLHVVTELLKRGANVDSATKKGNTALHIASLAGQEEVVRLLVEHGASVNVQSQNGFTPLYMAAQENHDNVVKYLLANGANQSLATEDGFTPLAVAMQQGHDKVVAVLLENDTRGKVRLPALHIAAKKDDCKAAALLLQNEHNPDVTSKSGFTPLHIASHYGNEGIANLLLNKGADVNYSAKHNITPLHVAAKWGKSNMVSLLLEKGANIESKTRDGLTPLHCAARSGHEQVVDMLLERGAPISSKTKNGLAPLHMSSQGDHVDAARILLYHRAPVDEVTVDYLTALHVAAHCGHARVAKLLLDRKADPNARALNGFTPLHIACKKNRIKVVELLLKHGASIEATTESGLTPLHVASFMGCMNIVIYLLQNEANPDVPTVRGETPLHLAARANQTDIIRILLRNGAQVDARAREQQTPLHIASRLGNVDIVMLLLQHGAAVDCTTKDLYSALHIAAKEGQDEVASVLLENGASPTATTKKGFTPLHLAAKYGNMKVARLLLQRDAPVDAQGKNGVTPLHVASHYDHQNVALLLLDKGASPHATAKNGHTPLHIAAKKNQMDIATTLLEYGAKANAESKAGFTPLHLSAQEGHIDMSSLLIDHQADTNHKAKNGLTPLHLCAQEDRVNVASVLVKNGAEIDATTKAGYTPLHVASHFGQANMVRYLLQEGSDVSSSTAVGYTPLHQAAQQGHCAIVHTLLEHGAPPNATTNQGQTAMSIAQKLGYISVEEALKGVTEPTITSAGLDEKYKVVSPETMQETFMSDSEDEGGEDTLLSEQPYRYLTVDEMKSLGDDSLPIDVRQDERMDSNRECMTVPPTAVDDTISPQHLKEAYSQFTTPDNIDIAKHPLHVGFLVSFLVDARGGAMRGCRHSGVRVIVPPRRAGMPMRVTCRYLKRDKLSHPPPLMEGEALASRILELGPVGAKFLGPVMIEVPHFGSLRGKEREIVILRSDNGETWREHTVDCSEEAVQDVLSHSFDKEDIAQLEESPRTTRILTTDFPHYFAVVTRVRQEVHAIGPEGGMVSSSVVPQVQAVFPQGALTKKIKVGLQAQPISAELAAKLLGNRVAVSPIVTVEPRRRKFHKPITLTIPKPQAANKGMINQYNGDAPTLRLLCSITGGTTRAQWEDVTGSTPFTFVNDCVSFTTTVSARFWLMDCRNVGDATKMATELYREAIHVPFMVKFVVFAKRVDPLEARLRIFCMTDDKEDKTLEHQEHFTEVAKSRDVEVLEGKTQYVEFAGNLVPVTKSGEQLQLGFRAFRENRLPFTVRVKDPHADCIGRTLFMREARLPKGEPPQQPICVLNIVLPEEIIPEAILPEHELHKYSFIQDSSGLESYQRVDLRLSDISNLLGRDWVRLADELAVSPSDINRLKTEHPHSVAQQGLAMLRLWLTQAGNKAQASTLESALSRLGRDDIVQQCVFNVDQSGLQLLKDESRDASLRRSIPYSDKDIMKDSESVEDISRIPHKKSGESVEKDDKEERKYEAEEKEVEEVKKSVSERRKEIEKRLSLDSPLVIKSETVSEKITIERQEDLSEKEIAEEKRVSSPEEEPSEMSFAQKRLSFEQGKRVIEMKPDKTTMKEVKERADERLLAEERRAAEELEQKKSMVDETSIPFEEKRKSFEQVSSEEKEKKEDKKKDDLRRDSALFEGVSQGLVRLDAAFAAAPQVQDLLSPKVSKTPPPSPAEFKDLTGTVAWTEDTTAPVIPTKPSQPQSQDWAEKGKPDSTVDSTQKGPSVIVKEIEETQQRDDKSIPVTSKGPHKITETVDIVTKDNASDDIIEKDKKYQYTMSVPNKQAFYDTLSSLTAFLEGEKNYYEKNISPNTLKPNVLVDNDVISSDETEGSQSKSDRSDKSFVGKMSKKIFGVFKKEEKEKSKKKKGKKNKHVKNLITEDSDKNSVSEQISSLPIQDNASNTVDEGRPQSMSSNKETPVNEQLENIKSINISANKDGSTKITTDKIKNDNTEHKLPENMESSDLIKLEEKNVKKKETNLSQNKVITFHSTDSTKTTSYTDGKTIFNNDVNINKNNGNTIKELNKMSDKELLKSDVKHLSFNTDVKFMDGHSTNIKTHIKETEKESGEKEALEADLLPNNNFKSGSYESSLTTTSGNNVTSSNEQLLVDKEHKLESVKDNQKAPIEHISPSTTITSTTKSPFEDNEKETNKLYNIINDSKEMANEAQEKSSTILKSTDTLIIDSKVCNKYDNLPSEIVAKQINEVPKLNNETETDQVINEIKENTVELEGNTIKISQTITEKSKTEVQKDTKNVIGHAKGTKEKSKSFLGGLFKKSDISNEKEKNNDVHDKSPKVNITAPVMKDKQVNVDIKVEGADITKRLTEYESKQLFETQLPEVINNADLNSTMGLPKLDASISDKNDFKTAEKTADSIEVDSSTIINNVKQNSEIFLHETLKLNEVVADESKTKVNNATKCVADNAKEGKEKSKSFLGGLFKKAETHLENEKDVPDASVILEITETKSNSKQDVNVDKPEGLDQLQVDVTDKKIGYDGKHSSFLHTAEPKLIDNQTVNIKEIHQSIDQIDITEDNKGNKIHDTGVQKDEKPFNELEGNIRTVINKVKENSETLADETSKLGEQIVDKTKTKVKDSAKCVTDNVKESKEKSKSFLGGLFKKSDSHREKEQVNSPDVSPNLNTTEPISNDKKVNVEQVLKREDKISSPLDLTEDKPGFDRNLSLKTQSTNSVNKNVGLHSTTLGEYNTDMPYNNTAITMQKDDKPFVYLEGSMSTVINKVEENSKIFLTETSKLSEDITDKSKTNVDNATKCLTGHVKEGKEKSKSFLGGLFKKSETHGEKGKNNYVPDVSPNLNTTELTLNEKKDVNTGPFHDDFDPIKSSVDIQEESTEHEGIPYNQTQLSHSIDTNLGLHSAELPEDNSGLSDNKDGKAMPKDDKTFDELEGNISTVINKLKENSEIFVDETSKLSGAITDKSKTTLNNATKCVTDTVKESKEKSESFLGGILKKSDTMGEKGKKHDILESSEKSTTTKTISGDNQEKKNTEPNHQDIVDYSDHERIPSIESHLTDTESVIKPNIDLAPTLSSNKYDSAISDDKDCKPNKISEKSRSHEEGQISTAADKKVKENAEELDDKIHAIGEQIENEVNNTSKFINENVKDSKEKSKSFIEGLFKKGNVQFKEEQQIISDKMSNSKVAEAISCGTQEVEKAEQLLKSIGQTTSSNDITEGDSNNKGEPLLQAQQSNIFNLDADSHHIGKPIYNTVSDIKEIKSDKNNKTQSFFESLLGSQSKNNAPESEIDQNIKITDTKESSNVEVDLKVKTDSLDTIPIKEVEVVASDNKNKLAEITSDITDKVNSGMITLKEFDNESEILECADINNKFGMPILEPIQSKIKYLQSEIESTFGKIDDVIKSTREDQSKEESKIDYSIIKTTTNEIGTSETDKSIKVLNTKLLSDSEIKSLLNKEENKIVPTPQEKHSKSDKGIDTEIKPMLKSESHQVEHSINDGKTQLNYIKTQATNILTNAKTSKVTDNGNEYTSHTSTVLREPDINVNVISKSIETDNSLKSNDLSNLRISNEDKLNNILIDMLIEQECMKQIHDSPTNQASADEKITEPAPQDSNTNSSFKEVLNTAASFSQIETLMSEGDLDKKSKAFTADHTSYVTTPTMERRKIGGSQRLSREERPALRDVSHILDYSSSEEDEMNQYIVTEPNDPFPPRKVTFQVESEDETYLKVSETSSEPDLEVTEMTPSPDPTSKRQGKVSVEGKTNIFDDLAKSRVNADKNIQKVERRFERMASETLDTDPDSKITADREFQRMVSQLSTEEVDAYINQWEEEGLTPSDEIDSTSHTVEGDLDLDVEALPEASLGSTNPFFTSDSQWIDFEHGIQDIPSIFWAFNTTPTSAMIQPNELDIPVKPISMTGESAAEETKKEPSPSVTREGEEALLDLATGLQESKGGVTGSASAPSSTK